MFLSGWWIVPAVIIGLVFVFAVVIWVGGKL